MIQRAMACVLLVAVQTGCGVPQMFQIEVPTTQVRRVSVTQESEEGSQVTAFIAVRNPNKAPLPLVRIQYTIDVGGKMISYQDEVHRTLPSDGIQVVVLPVAFATDGSSIGGRRFDISGSITYRPPGQFRKLLTESKVPLPTVPFAGSGRID